MIRRLPRPTRLAAALFCASLPGVFALSSPTSAQAHLPASRDDGDPHWLHVSPMAGAVYTRPGRTARPALALQFEVSRTMPVGLGMAGGYWFDEAHRPGQPDGLFGEVIFAYRFHLHLGGRVSPYAGPAVGILSDGTAGGRTVRWYFGGRGGVDIPFRGAWPAVRLEASYRHLSEAEGRGGADSAALMIGARWSVPVMP